MAEDPDPSTAAALRPAIPGGNGGTLRPFRPGESGNPLGGALPKRRLAAALAEVLDERGGPKALAGTLLDIALDREHKAAVPAAKEVYERLEPARGDGDSVPRAEVQDKINRIFGVIRAELDAPTAERVVRAAIDMLDGVRTVEAEIREVE